MSNYKKNKSSQVDLMSGKTKKIKYLEKCLRFMASMILKKYKPKIIAITGSIGKTSTKEAVYAVLFRNFNVRKSEKNYNNEIGVPLTIIGTDSGEGSFFGWCLVALRWLAVWIFPIKYPEVLILEMAADRAGDLQYLVEFAHPDISIITDISASHLEYFKTLDEILKEKATLVKALDKQGLAILNIDNIYLEKLKNGLNANVLSFGFAENADVRAMDVFLNCCGENGDLLGFLQRKINGLSFKLNYKGTTMPMRLNNILAKHNIYAALGGVSAGIGMGMNLVEIGASLENFILPSGRMNLISGIKNSFIIDDTYNASASSTLAALEMLCELRGDRKIAVLGDMLELGVNTEKDHMAVAKKFLEIKGDVFFAVGKRMQFAVEELKKNNFKGEIYVFQNPMDAGLKLQEILCNGDVVLVKGSQGMRMEKVVEETMLEPQKAPGLLCRQSEKWKNIPFST